MAISTKSEKELDSCKPLTHWIDCICHCTVETTRHWWINFQGCGFESQQTTTIDHKLTADPRICCVILYVLYTKQSRTLKNSGLACPQKTKKINIRTFPKLFFKAQLALLPRCVH